MDVRDVMTTEVTTCGPDTSFKDVVGLLLDQYISGVPVVDEDGQLLGIVTEADLVAHDAYGGQRRRLLSVLADRLVGHDAWIDKATALRASELMTTDLVTVRPQTDVALAARLMLERGVRRLPVVEAGHLVGIVARSDLLRWFQRSDDAIRVAVQELLEGSEAVVSPHEVVVSVEDGVAVLEGRVRDEDDRSSAEDLVRRVPGVVSVRDRLEVDETAPLLEDLHPPLG